MKEKTKNRKQKTEKETENATQAGNPVFPEWKTKNRTQENTLNRLKIGNR